MHRCAVTLAVTGTLALTTPLAAAIDNPGPLVAPSSATAISRCSLSCCPANPRRRSIPSP